jgi:hypothetical protein
MFRTGFLSTMIVVTLSGSLAAQPASQPAEIDLSRAVLVTPVALTAQEHKAVAMLIDEVQRRSRIRWTEAHAWPAGNTPVVAVGPASALREFAGPCADACAASPAPSAAEGFLLRTLDNRAVIVAGRDPRGVLFGVGRLLRELRMTRDSVRLPGGLNIATAPRYPLRGHQLGYRPKVNSYDGWTVAMFDQYIRDLAVFGSNAIELIPPRSDDAPSSPHFVMPQIDMMKAMSQLADDYGLDVWIWHPAMGVDYTRSSTVEFALKEWDEIYAKLPRVDAVFVPSGDPGHLEPKHLLPFLEKATQVLHRTHPKAQMWVSTQSFTPTRLNEFLSTLKAQQPTWLTGIVFGPQNRIPLPELRQALPAQYPIRHYPDITHSIQCQFPVPEWDLAYALTEQREVINPRPTDFARIIRMTDRYTIGFLTYSEGCNDDLNKIVWSGLGWDPDMPLIEILRQYARYFIGLKYEDTFAQGILGLETNWRGPLLTHRGVMTTLAQFQDMERGAGPHDLLNWRFQQALYRAYYDAYDARRLVYETELEQQAIDALRQAPGLGSLVAIDQAERILDRAVLNPVAQDLRARVFELAEALYQSIRMQLSVPRYKAIHVDRGANLDLIDTPLNNRLWLKARFAELRHKDTDRQRQEGIAEIVNWTNPGPGGCYDNLGNVAQSPHLVLEPDAAADPEFRHAPIRGSEYEPDRRMSWNGYAETRYDSPLRLRYGGLDPRAQYKVRVVYSGDTFQPKIRLVANDRYEIHPYAPKPYPIRPVEFDVPQAATAGGHLTLAWNQEPGRGGSGRGCQVAEVWLIRKAP